MDLDYLLVFGAALATFISPCVLPLLPVYVSYFAGSEPNRKKTFFNALAFCVGISLFYLAIFITAAALGNAFSKYIEENKFWINIVCGVILVLLGLKFMGILKIPFLNKSVNFNVKTENINIFNAFILGITFSFSMGMCAVGFGGFALIRTITTSHFLKSLLIGVLFVGTLDILFMACAMLIDQLKGMFSFIKRHYKIINLISGGLLVLIGILLACGVMDMITASMGG